MEFSLVTPEKPFFSDIAEMVLIPGSEGDFGVLPGHAPIISSLRVGVIEVHMPENGIRRFCVNGGFAEATPNNCTILATDCFDLGSTTREEIEQQFIKAASEDDKMALFNELRDKKGQ